MNDFDSQIADATLTMIQYMILTSHWRFETSQTKEGLFNQYIEKVTAVKIANRLLGLLIELSRVIDTVFEGSVDGQERICKAIGDPKVNNPKITGYREYP